MNNEKDYYIGEDAFDFFFSCIGYFNHYAYFTKELWRKVKGFKHADEAEIKCAFLSVWTEHTLGIRTCPVGCGWSNYQCSQESFDRYVEKYKPVLEDFYKWQLAQR